MQIKQIQKILILALLLTSMPTAIARNTNRDNLSYGYSQSKKGALYFQKKKLSKAELDALRLLCEIGFNEGRSNAWGNNDINAAISSMSWGRSWPENAKTTAYKTCNFPNYGGKPLYPAFLRNIESIQLNEGQCILANVASVDAKFGAIEGEFGSENGRINLTNNYSLYLFRNLKDKNGEWKIHQKSNPISISDAKRMFRRNDPVSLCLKFKPINCHMRSSNRVGNIYSITNRRTKEKRFGRIGLRECNGS